MKTLISGRSKEVFRAVILRIGNRQLKMRLIASVLIIALLAPMYYFGEFGKVKAQRNIPVQQPAPVTAPPEPYLMSSQGLFDLTEFPALQTLINPISDTYQSVAGFINGAETP